MLRAIQSKKDLLFSLTSNKKGKITIEIEIFQVDKENNWFFRIKDSVTYTKKEMQKKPLPTLPGEPLQFTEEEVDVLATESIYRERTYPASKIKQLGQAVNVSIDDTDFLNQLDVFMQKGLLVLTQAECTEAASKGELGIYLSEAQDWELVPVIE